MRVLHLAARRRYISDNSGGLEHMERKPLFVKPAEAARLIGCSRTSIYELIQSGEVPAVRFGGMLRIPLVALTKRAEDASRGMAPEANEDGR